MPQADGTILIDTEINADGMKAGSKEVEAAVRRMANSVNDLGTKARTALNKQVDSFSKLNKEYAAQAQKVDELKKKVAEYGAQKIPTAEYQEIQAQIDQATKRMNQLIASQERYLNVGGKTSSSSYKKMQYDIDELANTIKYAEGELKDLEASGKAFTFGNQTKQAAADMEKLAAAERKLSDMNNRLGTSYSSIKGTVRDYNNALLKSSSAQQKAANSGKRLSKSLKDTGKSANSANFGIGKMLGTSILFSFAFQAINGAITAIKDGFTNLAQYSGTTNNSISMLWSSLERLKNSLATAFAPILNVVAPILSKFIDMLSTAASYVSMFFAFLSGQSTYTRAIAVQKDYAASLADTAGAAGDAADATNAAAEAAERYLSPLDDINKYTPADTGSGNGGSGGGGGGGGGTGSGPLFEEVPIDNKFSSLLDTVLDKLKEIRDIFMSGFWDGLGDYKPLLEELKSDLSSIGKYLTDIFTDADVQTAAKNFVESFVYNVGRVAGSVSRVGLTLAVLIVGGIESYLSENVDRIKGYLISSFDATAEILDIIGGLSVSIADIFSSVFGPQMAQDLLGNIIGIFSEVFMGAQTLALSFGRDLLNMIAQPIIENKDLIASALYETLQPIEQITQSIETFIQNLVTKILDLYNAHIKPFIDSIASGISQIVGVLLSAYNEYIAPILDTLAAKFDEVLNGPVADALNSFLNVIGKIMDALTVLLENVLVPLISWIVENIVPVIAPIIETVGTVVLDLFGTIGNVVSGILDALGGLIDFISGVFSGNWKKAWNGIKTIFSGIWKSISSLFSGVWETLKNIVSGGVKSVKSLITTAWNAIKSLTSTIWNGIKTTLSGIWDGLKGTASNAFNAVKNVITNIWNNIKNIASNIWNEITGIVKSAINGIIGGANGMIRGVVSAVNSVINVLNNLNFTVPDWVPGIGGRSFGFNIGNIGAPQIPYLASGAVIPPNQEFLAVLGDQKQGNNIEAPESLIRRIVREETNGGKQRIEIPIYLGKKQIALAVVEGGKVIRSQTGKNPFELA